MDSLKKRYVYKFLSNLIGFFIGLGSTFVVNRSLGPKYFGEFNYLSSFFTQVMNFFDMGTQYCLFTKLSQRQKDFGLLIFYSYYVLFCSIIAVVFVKISYLFSFSSTFWPEYSVLVVYFAAGWGILDYVVRVMNQVMDAFGLSVSSEKVKILQKFIGLLMILIFYVLNSLNLIYYILVLCITLLFVIAVYLWIIKKNLKFKFFDPDLSRIQIKNYFKEFYVYSKPLFFLSVFNLFFVIFDRWFLEIFAGSIQQGFLGISLNIANICFLFTGAMTPLITREFSISFDQNDIEKMAVTFRRYIPTLYSVSAYFACFIVLQADKVVRIWGGVNYAGATTAMMIMAFYPIHQTYGQLSSSLLFATGKTKLYTKISIYFYLIGLPITFFLIAPSNLFGLGLGAVGLAIKMVLINFLSVNVILYFNTKYLKITFWKYLFHQFISAAALFVVAYTSVYLTDNIFRLSGLTLISFLVSGVIYTVLVVVVVWKQPLLFGLKKTDIGYLVKDATAKIKSKLK